MWQEWLNGILGIWVAVASFLYMAAGTDRTIIMISGIVVAILGFWGAASRPMMTNQRQQPRAM